MKTIGIIGGMSRESSLEYYRIINRAVRDRLGGMHSARMLMLSVDFAPVAALQRAGDWQPLTGRGFTASSTTNWCSAGQKLRPEKFIAASLRSG